MGAMKKLGNPALKNRCPVCGSGKWVPCDLDKGAGHNFVYATAEGTWVHPVRLGERRPKSG
jgi:hypothetical protein